MYINTGKAPVLFMVKTGNSNWVSRCVSIDLYSRAVASQVLSAQLSLTTVFGMGTGGPSTLKTLTLVHLQGFEPGTHWLRVSCSTNWAKGAESSLKMYLFLFLPSDATATASSVTLPTELNVHLLARTDSLRLSAIQSSLYSENWIKHLKLLLFSSSPRSISIGQLNTLLCVHLRPIKLVVYK